MTLRDMCPLKKVTPKRLAKYHADMKAGEATLNDPINVFRKFASDQISKMNVHSWVVHRNRGNLHRDIEVEMLVEKHFPAPVSWTKVTDAKPRPTRVLVYFPSQSSSVMDALYTHEGHFIVDGIDRTEAVTHWSYMPADPVD